MSVGRQQQRHGYNSNLRQRLVPRRGVQAAWAGLHRVTFRRNSAIGNATSIQMSPLTQKNRNEYNQQVVLAWDLHGLPLQQHRWHRGGGSTFQKLPIKKDKEMISSQAQRGHENNRSVHVAAVFVCRRRILRLRRASRDHPRLRDCRGKQTAAVPPFACGAEHFFTPDRRLTAD